jgi:hypothetical protein
MDRYRAPRHAFAAARLRQVGKPSNESPNAIKIPGAVRLLLAVDSSRFKSEITPAVRRWRFGVQLRAPLAIRAWIEP